MNIQRLLRVQTEVAARLDQIADLCLAYNTCGKCVDEFAAEFYYAVEQLVQGSDLHKLKLRHVNAECVPRIAAHQRKLNSLVRREKNAGEEPEETEETEETDANIDSPSG